MFLITSWGLTYTCDMKVLIYFDPISSLFYFFFSTKLTVLHGKFIQRVNLCYNLLKHCLFSVCIRCVLQILQQNSDVINPLAFIYFMLNISEINERIQNENCISSESINVCKMKIISSFTFVYI